MFDFLRKILGGKKTRVEIGFEALKAKAELAGEQHLSNQKLAAEKLVSDAIADVVEALGGNPELHTSVIGAMQKALLKDPGVKSKLMGAAQRKGMETLVNELQATIAATTVVSNATAEAAPTNTPPAA